jgi:protein-L-isoaspartate(D-aspartate) O-methyltransferase
MRDQSIQRNFTGLRMRMPLRSLSALAILFGCAGASVPDDEYTRLHQKLIEEIRAQAAVPAAGAPGGRISEAVLSAMRAVPRHEFVPKPYRHLAYRDRALPIGHGQTISQPYIVALMTDLAKVAAGSVVLEVGTGSGYQAAVLSRLVGRVYTVEIVEALAGRAAKVLVRLGYQNVTVRAGDGYKGWPEFAPFDAIIVTAAAPKIPPPLLQQLKSGGRLVMPVGGQTQVQSLMLIEKGRDGRIVRKSIISVRFVPLTRAR